MSTSSINKSEKTLICINSCLSDEESLTKLRDTEWFREVDESPEYDIVIALANPSISETHIEGQNLIIKTEEDYTNLCMKTYYMIDYFMCKTINDYFIKIDSKIIEGEHNKTSNLFSFDNFLKKFNEGAFKENYGGACPILGANPNHLRHWASTKNLTVIPELLLSELDIDKFPLKYWAGSAYSLSRGAAHKAHGRKDVFEAFKRLMSGCEDLCIGTIIDKL